MIPKRVRLRPWRSLGALLCGAVVAVAATLAQAQRPAVVTARMVLATDAVHPGTSARAAVEAKIASGFHINEHHPSLDYLIPTELKLDPSPQFSVAKLVYPKGELKSFSFSDTPLSVYQGTFAIGALLKVEAGTPPGEYKLQGRLSYQACNDHACLPPASVPVSLSVKVVKRAVALRRVNGRLFATIEFD